LITQTMPIPLLNHTDAQVHTMRCKRTTPANTPPQPKKTRASDFDRNASMTSTVQDETGRDEETNKIESFREADGCCCRSSQKTEFPAQSDSSNRFPPKIIGKLCSSTSHLSTSSINDPSPSLSFQYSSMLVEKDDGRRLSSERI
jgi:hypothetical protein